MSLAVNLGILGYFKYANFFIENWISAWDSPRRHHARLHPAGHPARRHLLLHLPDPLLLHRHLSGQPQGHPDPVAFGAFVSFFPQLVAGPIERATNLLPQITSPRTFTYEQGRDGMRLILWGMFKKVVVADSCAPYVDMCFDNPEAFSGSTLILGAILFSFQIYGDFSGYSDIAIGTAKLFGFELMTNFKFPYFSRDIAEFWRRWHISLSTWFRDYLYIPLGGSRVSKPKAIRNVFVIFLVSGFWHGANWTFIVWGGIHALLFIPLFLRGTNRKNTSDVVAEGRWLPSPRELLQMGWTFTAVTIAWVFFRADSVGIAMDYLTAFVSSICNMPSRPSLHSHFHRGIGSLDFWSRNLRETRWPASSMDAMATVFRSCLCGTSAILESQPALSISNSDAAIRKRHRPILRIAHCSAVCIGDGSATSSSLGERLVRKAQLIWSHASANLGFFGIHQNQVNATLSPRQQHLLSRN